MHNPLARDLEHVFAHTGDVWPALRGARIFLTGGTGFFGHWLLESFAWATNRLALDASITVLTRSPEAFRRKAPHLAGHPAIHLLAGDIRSFPFPEGRYTHVIHGAAENRAALYREQPLAMLDTIVDGTRRTLDFAVSAGAARFLLLSSGMVYQADPLDPRAVYAEGKRMAEMLCTLYQSQRLTCVAARGFAFVGPHLPLDTHFAIGNFIRACLDRRPIEIRGDGTPLRSYLYTADLAIWLWTLLERGESGRAYDVGSERALNIGQLAATVASVLEPETPVRVAGVPRPGVPPERYLPETRPARELGLREWIPLEEAIRRTAAWHRAPAAAHEILCSLEKPE